MARQLGLDLPSATALGRGDFLSAGPNQVAMAMIDAWPRWPGNKLVLYGPKGAGKTHLAHIWASESGATLLPANALAKADVASLAQGPVAVEDVDGLEGDETGQTALFHLHNLLLAEGKSLLLTGGTAPQHWPLALPDLVSRIAACPVAALEAPDDALLSMVLLKLFADRQLSPKPDLIAYLVTRMDRSFAAARDIVETLDRASIAEKRPITRSFARKLLEPALDNPGAS